MTGLPDGLKAYLRTPFVMIVWVMETFAKNRAWLKAFMAKPRVATVFKVVLALTLAVWVAIGLMSTDEQGQRLTDALKGFWSEAQDLNAQKKLLNQQNQEAAGESAQ